MKQLFEIECTEGRLDAALIWGLLSAQLRQGIVTVHEVGGSEPIIVNQCDPEDFITIELNCFPPLTGPGSLTCDRAGAVTAEDCKNCLGTGGCRYGKTDEEFQDMIKARNALRAWQDEIRDGL